MSEFQQFLYVKVAENYLSESGKQKNDTVLHIVYWEADEDDDAHFVIYGKRPKSKITGDFVPYRMKCHSMNQIHKFIKTVVSPDHNIAIELHQFYGETDDTKDWYNIDWENTADDGSTELVAYDVYPRTGFNGEQFLDIETSLMNVLTVLTSHEIV